MPRISLTDARVAALTPRKTAYDIRDSKLRGFGVRVLPSGRKHFFVHCQHREVRVWRIVGDASSTGVHEARLSATEMLAAIRRGETMPLRPDETLFEAVAEAVFQRYERVWKPRTLYVNRHYLRRQILPHFAGRPNRRYQRAGRPELVRLPARDASRRRQVHAGAFRDHERVGGDEPSSRGVQPLSRHPALPPERARGASCPTDEIRRLSKCLSAQAERRPRHVAVIRLLLLTGCRKSEILTLRWSDYREGHLFLRDSKTGPRTVWLSQPARNVLDALERSGPWVFSTSNGKQPRSTSWLQLFWTRTRAEAGLCDVRLHDLRHTHASLALRQGETVLAIGKLLGHRSPETTLKYTHLVDTMVHEAAETVGAVLGQGTQLHPFDASSGSSSG